MRIFGLALTAAALFLPLIWFIPMTAERDASAVFSQYIGSFALIAMGITQLFATRFGWLELVFGGLDRIYVQHKWLGISALVAVFLHDTIDPEMRGLGRETALADLAESLGEFSYYGLLILVAITLLTFIPYHLWRWTHKLMGGIFALSAFHYFFIMKPFANTDPVGLYVLGFCVLGIAAYIYTLLPERFQRSKRPYTISQIERTGDAIAVTMMPDKRAVSYRPGQFAFVSFDTPGLQESHPYTISKAPDETGSLRFTIKPMGDHTSRLARQLKAGAGARVQGAYGHFGNAGRRGTRIWIAGGIGITPFVALSQDLANKSEDLAAPVHLFYCVKNRSTAAHLDALEALCKARGDFTLHLVESGFGARLNAHAIKTAVGTNFNKARVSFCGPASMRDSLKRDLVSHGLATRRFAYEEFEIRSGLFGLEKLVMWLSTLVFSAVSRRLNRSAGRAEKG